jgi:Na+-transporting methylmalonyl-CoA/oxaloacetate decarboxylase gamma subunit
MNVVIGALEVMGFGVSGVFLVLTLFYGLIKLMIKMFPENEQESR